MTASREEPKRDPSVAPMWAAVEATRRAGEPGTVVFPRPAEPLVIWQVDADDRAPCRGGSR